MLLYASRRPKQEVVKDVSLKPLEFFRDTFIRN